MKWEILRYSIAGVFLAAGSWYDWKSRSIPVRLLLGAGGVGLICCFAMGMSKFLPGILTAVGLVVVSRVTKEALGYGDSLGILVLGCCLVLEELVVLLLVSFGIVFCFGLWHVAVRKGKKTDTLPLFPVLLIVYIGMVVL